MNTEQFFSNIMTICNWDKLGNDDEVLKPLIEYLSKQSDEEIFSFDDIMAELLYDLDTRKNFKIACKYYNHSDDTFLYSRCVALINGTDYYKKVQQGKVKDIWTSEFEAILGVPSSAWAKKHNSNLNDYPHLTALCFETGSNTEKWK
ncbi:MAG: DUF4240 domain-containing protein [Huintestinicola sp.]